jgi:dTMP kinase
MSLIVIEGLDGSGKSTQIKKLCDHLDERQKTYEYIHFPRPDAPVFGDLISRFLRGEFGSIEQVNPYLVALIYAGDRNDAAQTIRRKLSQGQVVLLDRYVYSNVAYQCAKFSDPAERDRLKQWILELEFSYYRIPRPDLNLFLDVPFGFTERNLLNARNGKDRHYLDGNHDIHEIDMDFQKKVRDIYLDLSETDPLVRIINCSEDGTSMLHPSEVFRKIHDILARENHI